ncbi:MAG: SDR family oxidoreductase [Myxococcales bacterium]|nr:SDR family oxidoreductase [Myxococcales bacterium]
MLLENKVAILYGAGGHIGRAVARVFAREGAIVCATGRDVGPVDGLTGELRAAGGRAHAARVDALDARAVEAHFAAVIEQHGGVDISFNMIALQDVQGPELIAMELEDYLRPITIAARTQFLTATAAARHMVTRGRGLIMTIVATPSRLALPLVGGFGTACGAIEGMMRTLAAEVGPKGVRVCWLRSAGSPESFPATDPDSPADGSAGITNAEYRQALSDSTLLRRMPTLEEVGEAAAWLASGRASAITGAAMNLTCGQIVD